MCYSLGMTGVGLLNLGVVAGTGVVGAESDAVGVEIARIY